MVPTKIPSAPKSRTIFVPIGYLNTFFSDVGGASSASSTSVDALGASLVVLVGEFVFCAGEPRDFLLGVSSSLDPSGVLVGLARARLTGPFGSTYPFCFAGGVASAPRDFLHVFLFRA